MTITDTDQAGSSGVIDNYNLALYGGSHLGALAARFGAAYAFHDLNMIAALYSPGFSEMVKSNYNAGTMQFWGELQGGIPLCIFCQSIRLIFKHFADEIFSYV